jgi:hypothetical protein
MPRANRPFLPLAYHSAMQRRQLQSFQMFQSFNRWAPLKTFEERSRESILQQQDRRWEFGLCREREKRARQLKHLQTEACPFANLSKEKRTQMGAHPHGHEELCVAQT